MSTEENKFLHEMKNKWKNHSLTLHDTESFIAALVKDNGRLRSKVVSLQTEQSRKPEKKKTTTFTTISFTNGESVSFRAALLEDKSTTNWLLFLKGDGTELGFNTRNITYIESTN